jgi:hypothetical protein
MNKKQSLVWIILAAALLVCGCGGGSAAPPTIQVTLSTMPPSSLAVNGTATVAATVANDPAMAGVSWSCMPAGSCGSFNPTSTASGANSTYTAPAASPSGGKVTIIATSVTLATQSASTQVTITAPPSNATLNGQYAFLIRAQVGNQTTRGNTTFIGSVNLDGKGNLQQLPTLCVDPMTSAQVACAGMEEIIASQYQGDRADPILPTTPANAPNTSSYSVGANGLGTMRLVTNLGETLDLDFVVTSTFHAEIIEIDGNPGSGSMDLQTTSTGQTGGFATSQISGTYSFILDGVDTANPPTDKLSAGGSFSADGKGTLSSGTFDLNDNNGGFSPGTFTGSVHTAPNANGRGQMVFNLTGGAGTRVFTFYIVNNKVLRMFEDDGVDFTGGSVYAQGSTAPPQAGKFVYQHSGWSSAGRTIGAGQFTVGAGGSISTGVSDSDACCISTSAITATAVTGSYMPALTSGSLTLTDAAGASTFRVYPVDPTLNILDINNSSGGGGALLLHTDAGIIGSGLLLPQSLGASPNITGNQVLNLENAIESSSPREVALVGVFTSDGTSAFTGGVADYDRDDTVNPTTSVMLNATFTGTYQADTTFSGHFTGAFTIPTPTGGYPFITPSTNTFSVSIYQASSTQAFIVQTDTSANSIGRIIQLQLP